MLVSGMVKLLNMFLKPPKPWTSWTNMSLTLYRKFVTRHFLHAFLTVFTHHRSVMQPIYAWSMLPSPKAKPLTVCNRLKWRNSRIFEGHVFQQLPQSQLLSKKRSTFFCSKKGFEEYQNHAKIMQGVFFAGKKHADLRGQDMNWT